MTENGNIEDEWLAKTGRAPKPEGEYIPAEPDTLCMKGFKKFLDMRSAPDQATNREYFAAKGYDAETVIGFYHSYEQRREARYKPQVAKPIGWN